MDLDEEIDRLYGTPLDEFVQARDELAKRLTRDGDREAGARVKALRKPTVGAWALNQAVRRRRTETDALLATGKRLRAAHESLLSGGDSAALRETMEEERSLTSALADCAEAIASETGKSGPALRDRVRATLHAAAVQEEPARSSRRGASYASARPWASDPSTASWPARRKRRRRSGPARPRRAGGPARSRLATPGAPTAQPGAAPSAPLRPSVRPRKTALRFPIHGS